MQMIQSAIKLIRLLSALVVVIFTFCSAGTLPNKQNKQDKEGRENIFLADPTIFYNRGTYYLYGTGGVQYTDGFAAYTSADLKTWSGPVGAKEGYALKKGDAFGDAKFWAPQVFQYHNQFYIAYAANEYIGIAFSNNPLGPFIQKNLTPISEETKQIDPFVFIDENGTKYLYYVVVANGGNRIFVAEMNDDLLSVKKETVKQCIEATMFWENTGNAKWLVTEGPTVIKHNNLYYLIYSANDFRSIDYAVGYAVSKSPYGPWQKYEGNPIIHKNKTGQNGSGHGDLVKGRNKKLYYVFHTHNSPGKTSPRKTAIMELEFKKDKKSGVDILAADPASFRYLHKK
jgi:beta-xylosidase